MTTYYGECLLHLAWLLTWILMQDNHPLGKDWPLDWWDQGMEGWNESASLVGDSLLSAVEFSTIILARIQDVSMYKVHLPILFHADCLCQNPRYQETILARKRARRLWMQVQRFKWGLTTLSPLHSGTWQALLTWHPLKPTSAPQQLL